MRISDWSSDVCSSDLFEIVADLEDRLILEQRLQLGGGESGVDLRRAIRKQVVPAMLQRDVAGAAAIGRQADADEVGGDAVTAVRLGVEGDEALLVGLGDPAIQRRFVGDGLIGRTRSEEHTSELQSLMRSSYAVFCLKKKHKRLNQG